MPFRSLLLFCGATCAAAPTNFLSVDDAIRLAWANDPGVAALALAPEVARAREEQAAQRPNPDLELRGGMPLKGDSEWSVGVGVSQRLPRRDRIERARAFAQLGAAAAEFELRERRRIIAGEVRQLYYEAAVEGERCGLLRRALEAHRQLRAALESRRAAGEIAGAELDLLALETTRAEQALALAEAKYTASTQRLRGRLRWPSDAPFAIDAELAALLARPIPIVASDVETTRPALALAAHRVRQAEAALALARAETRGDWSVGGGVEFERRANDFTGRLEDEPRLSMSASVPWPRAVANRGEIREKQAALRIAEAELAALRDELRAEVAATLATVRVLQPVLAAQRGAFAAAVPLSESLRAGFERGEVSSLQLAQARQQRFAMESDFLATAARYTDALAEAETAAGIVPTQP